MLAGAILGSALIGGFAAKKAADANKAAANTAAAATTAASDKAIDASTRGTEMVIAENRRQYDTTREDFAPWRDIGRKALDRIDAGIADGSYDMAGWSFEASPGYQFRLDEGRKAIEGSAAARGGLLSGRTMKNLLRYGQGVASDEFGAAWSRARTERTDRFNRNALLAGVGQQATGSTAAAGESATGRIGNAFQINASTIGGAATRAGAGVADAALRGGASTADMYGNFAGAANQGIENLLLYRMMGA